MGRMFTFEPITGCRYRNDYERIVAQLNKTYEDKDWAGAVRIIRTYSLDDLFFLIYFVGGVREVNHPFLVERIREAEETETKTLDLWFRNGYKSTILTVYQVIQEVMRRNSMVGIFSHTGGIAKSFLRRIKIQFETNGLLRSAFPDRIPENPMGSRGIMWDIDKGLQLLDGRNYGACIIASGLVDGMPTGIHLDYIVYDDTCVKESVSTAEQRDKLAEAYKLSFGLHTKNARYRVVGTRYHYGDLYSMLIASGGYTVHVHPITHNGNFPRKPEGAIDDVEPLGDGRPVLYDEQYVWERFKEMGKDVFSTQMLMNPTKADERAFSIEWLRYYTEAPKTRNYIFVDPANATSKDASYTVMWVIGVAPREYYYIKDCVRDKLQLKQRQQKLFELVEKWNCIRVYYERYSMQSDIQYIKEKQAEEGFYFPLYEVGGTKLSKDERILLLQPLLQEGRIIFPKALWYIDIHGKRRNLIEEFIKDEYLDFPLSATKDMLDALARIRDKQVKLHYDRVPERNDTQTEFVSPLYPEVYSRYGWLNL